MEENKLRFNVFDLLQNTFIYYKNTSRLFGEILTNSICPYLRIGRKFLLDVKVRLKK